MLYGVLHSVLVSASHVSCGGSDRCGKPVGNSVLYIILPQSASDVGGHSFMHFSSRCFLLHVPGLEQLKPPLSGPLSCAAPLQLSVPQSPNCLVILLSKAGDQNWHHKLASSAWEQYTSQHLFAVPLCLAMSKGRAQFVYGAHGHSSK